MLQSVVVITGASRGLGLEISRLLAREGARLVIAARGEEALRAAEMELSEFTDVVALPLDVGEDAEILVKTAVERFGRVDALINNASTVGPSPMPLLENLDWQDFERIFHVNVSAPLHLMQLVLPVMRAQGSGTIINVSSDAAVNAYAGWGGYGTSKAALEHLSRILAAEIEGSGIHVYVVDPGDMNTQMHREAEPGVDLSHLPGPEVSAPFFARLALHGDAEFARYEARGAAEGPGEAEEYAAQVTASVGA